jgi:hypothetical protein
MFFSLRLKAFVLLVKACSIYFKAGPEFIFGQNLMNRISVELQVLVKLYRIFG